MKNKPLNLAINLALLLFSLLFMLALSEIALRILKPKLQYIAGNDWVHSPTLIWELPKSSYKFIRGFDNHKEHLVINNALGLRQHREFSADKKKKTVRIGFFGDSFTHNYFMKAQYSFTEPLDYMLNKLGEGSFEVLNFGTGGYGTEQAFIKYLNEGTKLGLDVVFYVFNGSDLYNNIATNLIDYGKDGKMIFNTKKEDKVKKALRNLHLTYFYIEQSRKYKFGLFNDYLSQAITSITPEGVDQWMRREKRATEVESITGAAYNDLLERNPTDLGKTMVTHMYKIIREMNKEVEAHGSKFHILITPCPPEHKLAYIFKPVPIKTLHLHDAFTSMLSSHGYKEFDYMDYKYMNDDHWNESANKLAAIVLFKYLARELSLDYNGDDFIEQALYEYYSSFDMSVIGNEFIRNHQDVPDSIKAKIRKKYLELEYGLGFVQ